VSTNDSIGLVEDGPTHQPIEHLWSLRAIPGLAVCRPADARETAAAWLATVHQRGPVGLILSRQNLPVLDIDEKTINEGVARGGYLVRKAAAPKAIVIATGSEVSLALEAAQVLATDGIDVNVVSLPCLEWFNEQDQAYRDSVIDPSISARVAVEAGSTVGWHRYAGDRGAVIGLDHFGASADGPRLYSEFGITTDAIADAVRGVVG